MFFRFLFISIFSSASYLVSFADDWEIQNPIPTDNQIRSVFFTDSNHGWAVEANGWILHTSDGGKNWKHNYTKKLFTANSVFFTDSLNGWVVGSRKIYVSDPDGGIILHTSDGGKSWEEQIPGTSWGLVSVFFIDSSTGWAVGYDGMIHTTDGGQKWSIISEGANDIFFVDKDTGWCVNIGISKTTDGGQTWEKQFDNFTLYDIYFIDKQNGWVVGVEGVILNTSDGGENWIMQDSGLCLSLKSVFFTNADNGWAVGSPDAYYTKGCAFYTTDGGKKWNRCNQLDSINFSCIYFTDLTNGWAVGYGSIKQGKIVHTADGGTAWHPQSHSVTNQGLRSIYFTDKNTGWLVGNKGTIVHTASGGKNWNTQASNVTDNLSDVFFMDSQTGYAVGNNGTLIFTSDGGNSWEKLDFKKQYDLRSVFFIDKNIGWVTGGIHLWDSTGWTVDTEAVFKTIDGGLNWETQRIVYSNIEYNSLQFTDENTGWMVSNWATGWGDILNTSDGGETWIFQTDSINNIHLLNDLFFLDSNYGWAVGQNGLLSTSDGGKNWVRHPAQDSMGALTSVYFTDINNGWISAIDFKIVYNTTNGGQSWNKQTPEGIGGVYRLFFPDPYNGWAVAGNSIWYHYRDTTIGIIVPDNTKKNLKENFIISYNSINSIIGINYTIRKPCRINISVYTTSGKKIRTIINNFQQPGVYKTTWDCRDDSGLKVGNGCYLVRLGSDKEEVTRKLILSR